MEKDKLLLAVAHNSNNSSRGGWSRVLARVVLTSLLRRVSPNGKYPSHSCNLCCMDSVSEPFCLSLTLSTTTFHPSDRLGLDRHNSAGRAAAEDLLYPTSLRPVKKVKGHDDLRH